MADFEKKNKPKKGTKGEAGDKKATKSSADPNLKWYKKKWFKVLLTIFLVCVIVGSIVAGGFILYVFSTMKNDDDLLNLDNVKLAYTTIIYAGDKESEDKSVVSSLNSKSNRIWIDFENIPADMVNAVIAVEDERFYNHKGVDWKRTIASTVNELIPIFGSRQGGSTITQQVVRNVTNDRASNFLEGYARKAREIFRALKLEKMYDKEQILETYLNIFHLANGTDGVQAAAYLYFGKDVKDLTLAECAALAGITKDPVKYDPFKNPENNRERQLSILKKMFEQGMIETQEEYDSAVAQQLEFKTQEYEEQRAQVNSYYVDAVIEKVLADLREKYEYSKEEAFNLLYTGGLRIYTPQDPKVQSIMEEIYKNPDYFIKTKADVQPESAAVVMDFKGNVVGLVGGRGEKTGDRVQNRATQTLRQNGSTMKPIGVYGPAIEKDLVTWSTVIEDSAVKNINGKPWPVNYYGAYRGPTTVQSALQKSVNTVAVKVEQMVTPQAAYNHLTSNLGVSTLVENRDGKSDIDLSPMALGALTDGISPLELTAAYAPFGNGGTYYEPKLYTLVEDQFGNVLLDNTTAKSNRAYSEQTTFVMNQMLQTVFKTGGTAAAYNYGNMPLAGKTGTTQNSRDIWFAGMNPYYTCAVWWGYDQGDTALSENGYQPAATWKRIMSGISAGLPYKNFPTATGVQQEKYCSKSGLLATEGCTETATGWYKSSKVPAACTQCEAPPKPEEKPPTSSSGSSSGGTSSGVTPSVPEDNTSSSSSSSSKSSSKAPAAN